MKDFTVIEKDGREHLAIRTGMKTGSKGVQKLYQEGLPKGYVISDDRITVWNAKGWQAIDGEIYLYGDYYKGEPLAEIENSPKLEALHYIERLHHALTIADQKHIEVPIISYRSVLFLESGGVLFIPARVAETIHSYLSSEDALTEVERLSHPDCVRPEDKHGFTVLTLLYSLLCEEPPFPAENSLERTDLLSYYQVLPPEYFQAGLDTKVSRTIAAALCNPADKMPSPKRIYEILQHVRTLIEQEKIRFPPQPIPDLEKERRKRLFRHRFQASLQRNKTRWILIGGAVMLVMLMLTTRYGSSDGPDYSVLNPEQVIESFYQGFNSRDHLMMDELTTEKAANTEIREVMQMYLTSSIQMGYTQQQGLLTPQEYMDAGESAGPTQNVYGITELSLSHRQSDAEQEIYQVSFVKWNPLIEDYSDTPPGTEAELRGPDIERTRRVDRVRVAQTE
ncbi:MAG: hypothetical protein ACOC0D_03220, partial [Spirochaeta sp.]